jgi:alpha-galactosidase
MFRSILIFLLFIFFAGRSFAQVAPIVIETAKTSIVYKVKKNGRLYQAYLGEKLKDAGEYASLPDTRNEAYIGAGMEDLFTPALQVQHADKNPSLELHFLSVQVKQPDKNTTITSLLLKDPKYAFEVSLNFAAFYQENIIKAWTEISNYEKGSVWLQNYASSLLHLNAQQYWLTQFHGDWGMEARMEETQLTAGIREIDSKLGTRANKFLSPMFLLSLNAPAKENTGDVLAGTLAWTGNYNLHFEIDNINSLRILSGINSYASDYELKPGERFITPAFIFTFSTHGKGEATRNLHQWARHYGIMDGDRPRYTLLNNWEATGFNFTQDTLVNLFDNAAKLGVDLFLLDDGWFGNKYPRNNDKAGLGDWQENKQKMPGGIGFLVKESESKGIKFGIWLEPEMVNPKSELYEKHPEWILKLANRDENYQRNQLVLDLSNPRVQDFVFNMVDNMLTANPQLAYIKWDCNRTMTNSYSKYLGPRQSHLFIDYVNGLYSVLERLHSKHPHLPMMLCSGGGGRTDYGALKYFTEFWPSDNTDGLERVYIQWGYSYFFPALAVSNHITSSGKQSLKFRTDVAMMGKLGYDINIKELKPEELEFSKAAVQNYNRMSPVIWYGDLYHLVSPYDENRAVLMYVDSTQNKAVVFNYNLNTRFGEQLDEVKLHALDANKKYKIEEINLVPGSKPVTIYHDKIYSGDYLMKIGLQFHKGRPVPLSSIVLLLTAQ